MSKANELLDQAIELTEEKRNEMIENIKNNPEEWFEIIVEQYKIIKQLGNYITDIRDAMGPGPSSPPNKKLN